MRFFARIVDGSVSRFETVGQSLPADRINSRRSDHRLKRTETPGPPSAMSDRAKTPTVAHRAQHKLSPFTTPFRAVAYPVIWAPLLSRHRRRLRMGAPVRTEPDGGGPARPRPGEYGPADPAAPVTEFVRATPDENVMPPIVPTTRNSRIIPLAAPIHAMTGGSVPHPGAFRRTIHDRMKMR